MEVNEVMGKHFEEKEKNDQKQEKNDNEVDNELLNSLKEKLEAQKKEVEDREDRLKRLMAEFDNFKKRSAKEREGLYNSLLSDIAVSLLPVVDNLEKAASVATEDENYKIGVEMVLKQFKEVLKANGINEIETVGKTFDPELHEAISSVDDPELQSQEIKEEYRKGYMIGDKVIRHSLVVVAN
ncbi:MAG: nucleotide exchange factor GrpE [Clostridia bacterium]|nr:nucleotide exchange factor GrpE [Clostridia bacterium]